MIAAGLAAAFAAALLGLGAVSRSSPGPPAKAPVAAWYWTMAVSPSDPDVLVLGTDAGLFRSADRGKTWQPTGPARFDATSLAQSGDTVFAAGVRPARPLGPVVQKGGVRSAPDGAGVLAASADGGVTWRELRPAGLPRGGVQALAADPSGRPDLYALLTDGALYRSTDGARSFRMVSPRVGAPPWALAVVPGGGLAAGDMDTGNYLSADGRTWRRSGFADGRGGRMVMEYAADPGGSGRLLMTSYGVDLSTDGGRSWHVALRSKVMFGPVAYAPGAAKVAYAVGFDGSVWRSGDGGESWRQVS